jgi:hypothetical protein
MALFESKPAEQQLQLDYGDFSSVEDIHQAWDRAAEREKVTLIDGREELREWARVLKQVQRRGVRIFAFANNHYEGFAPETVRLFNQIWVEGKARHSRDL